MRGGVLGVCHLTVMHKVLDFLEQPLDPYQTKIQNVDFKTRGFMKNLEPQSSGDHLLLKLQSVGYFD